MYSDVFRGKHGCCFTGHRPDALPRFGSAEDTRLRLRLIETVSAAVECGVSAFYNGGARGFDLMSAETVLSAREKGHEELRLFLFLPSPHHTDGWPENERKRFERIAEKAEDIVCATDSNLPYAYLLRNRLLVDRADCCICYLKKMTGGTLYTVNYALEHGLPVINLYRDEILPTR